jgi:hypothetical protein
MSGINESALDDLLWDRAVGASSPDDEVTLARLLETSPEVDVEDYERVVGEVAAALVERVADEALPAPHAARIRQTGVRAVSTGGERPLTLVRGKGGYLVDRPVPVKAPPSAGRWVQWSGWAAAAALAAVTFWPSGQGPSATGELRAALLDDPAVVQVDWTATEDPAAQSAAGDVVWSTETQRGVMRFTGLEANDPSVAQYQLWIFDATRDERFPVDGGVFDVPPGGGDVLVEITPRIAVREPALFAVTVERPGGVVVSDRERIVVLAQLSD